MDRGVWLAIVLGITKSRTHGVTVEVTLHKAHVIAVEITDSFVSSRCDFYTAVLRSLG